ncbi:hypothetical protein NMY22_g11096 [Coprinellus aureogranulatus]|nr:hypothetical protein NMY22_g11096 [Coprinellus aureogranulatus]
MHFSTQLRPIKPRVKGLPPSLPTRYILGLTVVKPGGIKPGPRPSLDSSPIASQKRRIPRNPRQVPSSKHKANAVLKSGSDSESEEDFDLELDDLVHPPICPETSSQSIVVAKRGSKMNVDLSRPGPMLDPRIFGLRKPPMSIYFPYFKVYIEEEERKMREMERRGAVGQTKHSATAACKETNIVVSAPQAPPLPSRKTL